ncbi:MAG: hydrogenase formation protein HypD [Eubacterium sp.]|jgi:hydrogenase expression/formation protein HypD|nr:hydrogenase formation protein HypD [Eubacterium sp.]MCH4046529.1 hydrogenase formation protein HypD [Eubacterium sp.]MCH4079624.1 hydrogenase formation protein HypD [Eubacterium sp.]MCH4110182.1 hydrogenase formation protein HypD [Eubacterium sp.]MCI1307445.1 hydrogenase formation protein HypD [Eubacterium sp.]
MKAAEQAAEIIRNYDGRKLRIMEVCGTHTHEIFRQGIRKMLPENIQLISGPGCPVCVTPVGYIDEAVYLALEKGCTITTFGDLVRVPGSEKSLASARAEGARVKPVYSPLDALEYAENHPEEQLVFLSVGFETTTPPSLMAVRQAKKEGLQNFSILTANKTMDNAYLALKDSADAFLYPGHVSTITGTKIYYDLMKEGISGVVTGFTGPELLTALAVIVKKSQEGKPFFMNCYPRVVTDEGSPSARKLAAEMTDPIDSEWRGIGIIPKSGIQLKEEYADYDARKKYDVPEMQGHANPACRCGSVLKGEITPQECRVFGKGCTPEHPIGACMVSGEGACAAFYKYGRDF